MKKNLIIIILVVLLLGLGGYLVYDKVVDKDENNILENQQELSFDTAVAKTFVDNIMNLNVYNIFERLSKSGLSEEIKLSMAIANLEPDNSYTCSESFDINTNFGEYRPVNDDSWGCYSTDKVDSFSYDLVNKEYKNLFGNSINASKTSVLETMVYDYSNKTDCYVSLAPFKTIVGNLYYYDIESAVLKENQLKIEISYLTYTYVTLDSELFKYTLNGSLYTDKTEEDIMKAYNENVESLSHLTFIYEKENEKYILKSVN